MDRTVFLLLALFIILLVGHYYLQESFTDASGTDSSGTLVTLSLKDLLTMFSPLYESSKESDSSSDDEKKNTVNYIIGSPSQSTYDSQFRESLIKDVKDVVRDELLQGGAAQAAALGAPYGGVGGEDTVLTDSCIDSFSSQQGADFMKYIPGKNPADYVRKDSIPCYGCSLPTN
jgi:hypothetical protein